MLDPVQPAEQGIAVKSRPLALGVHLLEDNRELSLKGHGYELCPGTDAYGPDRELPKNAGYEPRVMGMEKRHR